MLLLSKLTRPTVPPTFVDRPRLYHQLDRWRDYRALLVHAPAGYGKSSLLSRWIECRELQSRSAWLTLDEGDGEARQFVRYVAGALDRIAPGALAVVEPILEDSQGGAQRALTRLLVALQENLLPAAHQDQAILLVLDDLHRVQTPAVNDLLLSLLEHGPKSLHLVLLTRHTVGMPLARLLAHEEILELSRNELRFSEGEVRDYIRTRGFLAPTQDEVTQLTARSEGWITALQLAVLSLRGRECTADLINALRGDKKWLAHFLTDEVLQQQTHEVQRFLLYTSILDEFNAPLCAAVSGDSAAYARLAAIAQADLFLIPLDDGEEWFRYHHLFQELLQRRLRSQVESDTIPELHRRAAAWLADAGRVHAAVGHLLLAEDEEATVALAEAHMRSVITRSPYEGQRLFALLPEDLVKRRPRLMLDRCFLSMLFGSEELDFWVDQTEKTLETHGLLGEHGAASYGEWLVQKSAVAYRRDDYDAARRDLNQADRYAAMLPGLVGGVAAFLHMHLKHYEGDHNRATHHARQALAAFDRADFSLGVVAVRREMARWSMRLGRSKEASLQFRELFDRWQSDQLLLTRDITLASFYAALNHYWQNQLSLAHVYHAEMSRLADQLQDQELIFLAGVLQQFLSAPGQGDSLGSEQQADGSQAVMNETIEEVLLDLKTHILIGLGRRDLAWEGAERLASEITAWPTDHIRLPLITYLYGYVARGHALDEVTSLLTQMLALAEQNGERFYQLHLLALRAWQQRQLGNPEALASLLDDAVKLARETGYIRVLLDIPNLVELRPELTSLRESALPDEPSAAPLSDIVLTGQEARVLELLATEHTYQEIADELVISVNTVRTHVRNIYKKLSVGRRSRAVRTARQLGLLPG